MARYARLALVAILAATAAVGASIASAEPSEAADELIATTLYPGWNLIGWINEETPAPELFRELPRVASIHDGVGGAAYRDATSAARPMAVLQPGKAYWLRVSPGDPVRWDRPSTVAVRRFDLDAGFQFIGWTGTDGILASEAFAEIEQQLVAAWRWDAAGQRFSGWAPDGHADDRDPLRIDRGAGLILRLAEPVSWLHPFDLLITFPGGLDDLGYLDLPEDFAATVRSDVLWAAEVMSSRFGLEIDPRRLEIRIPTTQDALWQEHGGRRPLGGGGFAVSSPEKQLIVLPWTQWRFNARRSLAHEYHHILQFELSGGQWVHAPAWLVEGTATWFGNELGGSERGGQPLTGGELQYLTTDVDLRSAASAPYHEVHHIGLVAAAMLADRAGPESLVEFWANLAGVSGRAGVPAVFRETFGLSLDEFYDYFYETRRPLFAFVSGRIRTSDGPVPPIWISAYDTGRVDTIPGRALFSSTFNAETARDGSFRLTLPRYDVDLRTPNEWVFDLAHRVASRADTSFFLSGCEARVGRDRGLATPQQPERYFLAGPAETVEDLDFFVSTHFCEYWVSAHLRDASGELVEIGSPNFCAPGSWCTFARRDPNGAYRARMPGPDGVVLRSTRHCPESDSSRLFVADGHFTTDLKEAHRFTPSLTSTTIEIEIAKEPSCPAD